MQPVAIMIDFDGTILNTMGKYTSLGTDVIAKHFGVSKKKAREIFYANAGIPFPEVLKKVFSKSSKAAVEACAKEYNERKLKDVYSMAKPYRDVEPALRALKSKSFNMFISSSTEAAVIKPLLKKHGLTKYFSEVYGLNQGTKRSHIETVISQKGIEKVCFIGDSKVDVGLRKRFAKGVVFTIGRTGKKSQGLHKRKTLLKSGATFVTSNLNTVSTIDFAKATQKSIQGKRYRRPLKTVIRQFRKRLRH